MYSLAKTKFKKCTGQAMPKVLSGREDAIQRERGSREVGLWKPVADLGGGQGSPGGGGMVSAQYLRGARRGGGIFWPVGQKFWARGK